MFGPFDTVRSGLRQVARGVEPDGLTPAEAAAAIEALCAVEKLAAGARLRLARRIDESVTGTTGEAGRVRWLARQAGQTVGQAQRDLEASEALAGLAVTDRAVRDGELSTVQAHEVVTAAVADPAAEGSLLQTARRASVAELKLHARRVRSAAIDTEEKAKRAHAGRDVVSGVDVDEGVGAVKVTGPCDRIGELLALLEPWVQARFKQARTAGRRERRGALVFDALLDALRYAGVARRGGSGDGLVPTGPPVSVLARVDAVALLRGHTVAGEVCEIDGLGPVPIEALRALLPQAAIDLIVTNGTDVFNVTHLGRSTTTRQQTVMDWIGGQCTRLGCSATRHLQIDHRIDWSRIHITELANLDWLCPADHHHKTHEGWALVAGTGRRPMVPPDHPDHPANAPPPPDPRPPTASPPETGSNQEPRPTATRPDRHGPAATGHGPHPHLDNRTDPRPRDGGEAPRPGALPPTPRPRPRFLAPRPSADRSTAPGSR